MINLFHSGGCHDSCCLKVQNVSVKIGGDKILNINAAIIKLARDRYFLTLRNDVTMNVTNGGKSN